MKRLALMALWFWEPIDAYLTKRYGHKQGNAWYIRTTCSLINIAYKE